MDPNWQPVREWLGNALLGLLGWLGIDIVRKFRGHGRRLAKLEQDRVTREDLDELRESMNASLANGFTRIESRTDEILLHLASRDRR